MVFMTNVFASMEMQTYGRYSQSFLTTYHSQQSWKTKFSAFTEVFLPVLIHLIRFASSTEYKRSPTRVPFAIYFGLIPMIAVDGAFLPEVPDTVLVKTFLSNLTTLMDLQESQELISW